MKIRRVAFNTYLLAATLLLGCKSPQEKIDSADASKQKKELSTIRLHLETSGETASRANTVPILRASPILVNVEVDSFLDERDVTHAALIKQLGGFAIQVQFNDHGVFILDALSSSSRGKRVAIMSDFGEKRWLAAPVFSRRITNGVLVFTPDATHTEATRIVRGLNNVAEKIKKQDPFSPKW